MKRIIALLTLSFVLFACGGKKEQEKVDEMKEEVSEKVDEVTEQVEETADEVVEEVKEETKKVVKKTEELASGVTRQKQGKGEWTGTVVSLTDFVTGNPNNLSKDQAVEMVKANKMIAFYVDGTPYMVFNTDGSYAGKALAKSLDDGSTMIKGKLQNIGGMNVIIADIIE